MRGLIVGILVFIAALPGGNAQSANDLWQLATEQYNSEDYTSATMNYRQIERELVSFELYFNLGNCYYQLDSVANSILYFEKAIKQNPRNGQARENLELAIDQREDPISSIDEFFLKKWTNRMSDMLPPLGWGLVGLIFLWLAVWILVKSIRQNTLRLDRIRYGLSITAFLLCLFFGFVAFQNQTDSDYAIVMQSLDVKVAPDVLSATTRTITEGEKVMIIDKLEDFYKVRFVNYEHGWLPKSAIRHI